jgi:hypothetical protein
VSSDEDTQDLPALPPGSALVDPLHALVDALNEVQIACNQLLDAVRDQALGSIIVTAHNAHSWWLIAKATLPRAAVRARGTSTKSVVDRIEHAKRMLETTFYTLNNRLVVAIMTIDHPSVHQELEQLQQSLALAR